MEKVLNIVLVCNSDLNGGAAVVTYRLMSAMCSMGINASMLVMNKLGSDPRVHVVGTMLSRKLKFVAERGWIFTHNGFNRADLFKVSIANTGFDISHHPLVKEADVVILSWINQGLMSMSDVEHLLTTGKRVLWVMHDMWCITGACHHALDCKGYLHECGHCPYFYHGRYAHDLSSSLLRRKKELYDKYPGLTMIAVSSWLAGCAAKSAILSNHDVRVIPNAFPVEEFSTCPRRECNFSGVDSERKLIVMGAARLDDPIKDFPLAIDSLNKLIALRPDLANECQAVFYGGLRDTSILQKLQFPYCYLGHIDMKEIPELYARATVVLSTSRFETLPGTLIEGMAAGCTPVTTGNGGQCDIVEPGATGYITEDNATDIANVLAKALNRPVDRTLLHNAIAAKFSAQAVVTQFLSQL